MAATKIRGTVEVLSPQNVEELVADTGNYVRSRALTEEVVAERRQRYHTRRPQSTPNPNKDRSPVTGRRGTTAMDAHTLIGHTLRLQDWLNEKQVKTVQENADLEAKNTRQLYTGVLETENTFVKELESLLEREQMLTVRRRELLHKQWTERVQEPIRRQIDRQMHGPEYDELRRRKQQQHKEYLEHVNRKGHVFLDTIAPDEYYAMSLHPTRPSPLTIQTRALRDPLLTQQRQRADEDRLVMRCSTGATLTDRELRDLSLPRLPLVPLGRHGTECRTWLAMPMGHIESPVRRASRLRFKPDGNRTQIDFEQWSRLSSAGGGGEVDSGLVDGDLKMQRKRFYTLDLPNDRTQSHPAVRANCGGPQVRRQATTGPATGPITAPTVHLQTIA